MKPKSHVLNIEQLHGACKDQIALFRRLFGEEVLVTEKLCVAHASEFDWNWADENLLSYSMLAKYEMVLAMVDAKYTRVVSPAWTEYKRDKSTADETYKRIIVPAGIKRDRIVARAWARLYISDKVGP